MAITEFYEQQNVFLTGSTGFIGKLLIEKLIRCCNLNRIFLLVRPKFNKTQQERFKEIFNQKCFDEIKKTHPDFHKKVHLISGDCSEPNLGLSNDDLELLKNEVTCVIHAAANVRFDVGLRPILYTNVRSLRDLLRIAREMTKLKAFIYISTAFSHCPRNYIDERFYDIDVKPEKILNLIENIEDDLLEIITPRLLGKWPNTYVYTKALAEEIVRTEARDLPIAIFRPAIVVTTAKGPIIGWADNLHGFIGIIIGIGLGVLRSVNVKLESFAQIVPADFVTNAILASGWETARLHDGKENSKSDIKIYNFAVSNENYMCWGDFFKMMMALSLKYPTSLMLWYYSYWIGPSVLYHKIRVFLFHTVFSYFVDAILICVGKKPVAVRKYKKINKLLDALSYFGLGSWQFSMKNVENLYDQLSEADKETFYFDMRTLDWPEVCEDALIGGRKYLLNDPLETLPQARRKMRLLAFVHYFIVFAFYATLVVLAYKLFK